MPDQLRFKTNMPLMGRYEEFINKFLYTFTTGASALVGALCKLVEKPFLLEETLG